VFNALLLVAVAAGALAALLLPFGAHIAAITELPRPWLWVALCVATGQAVTLAMLALQQAAARPVAYAIMQVTQAVLVSLVTLWLVVGAAQDWRGPVRAQLLGALLFAAASLVLFVRGGFLRVTVSREHVRHALSFGLPLVPHVLAAVAIQAIDRLIITHHSGLAQTGVYTLGYQLGMVIGLLEDSFNRAWQPWLFERLRTADEGAKRRIVLFTYGYFGAITLCAVALGALAPWLLSLVAPARFGGAAAYVVWIALGYAFSGMYKMVSGYMFYAERTGVLAWMTILAAVINAAMSLMLVPRHGPVGAAYAATIGFAASFLLTWVAAARVYPMPWLGALRGLRPRGGAP
jgi:O-antigen/teichoic acid export membrane protein